MLFHVYVGGDLAVQLPHFKVALKKIKQHHPKTDTVVRYRFVKYVREHADFTENRFVDWLLRSNAHIIMTHPNQALERSWNNDILQGQLNRLSLHPGFPSCGELTCPIFQQDKKRYLEAIPGLTTPTFFISLQNFSRNDRLVDKNAFYNENKDLLEFLEENCEGTYIFN
jgi:hypothetical protein